MTSYYTLARKDTAVVGEPLAQDEPWVSADPRQVAVSEITDGGYPTLSELTSQWVLVRVTPIGDAVADGDIYNAEGWTIDSVEPLTSLLGPQAEHIITADALFRDKLNSGYAEQGTPEAVYIDAVNQLYSIDGDTVRAAEDAAEDALRAAGVDVDFTFGLGACVAGAPIMALAARDLIGTTPDWTWDTYRVLTGPWVAAVGPIHPDDAPRIAKEA